MFRFLFKIVSWTGRIMIGAAELILPAFITQSKIWIVTTHALFHAGKTVLHAKTFALFSGCSFILGAFVTPISVIKYRHYAALEESEQTKKTETNQLDEISSKRQKWRNISIVSSAGLLTCCAGAFIQGALVYHEALTLLNTTVDVITK
mmetsp:Transcript_18622/g.26112  ORF Transcript_18622/g.26112 Transcript_18622/m.26112 type:complete len:149 (+) Transcript_18622:75-521(+)